MEVIDLFRGPTPSLATSRAIVHCRGGEVVLGPGDSPQQSSNLTISSPHKHAAAADLAAVVSPHLGTGAHHVTACMGVEHRTGHITPNATQ